MKSTMWLRGCVATLCVILHFLGFLVYNEETILLGCFLLFVVFAYNSVSAAIVEELEDRGNRIGEVYEASRTVYSLAVQELIEHHKTRQTLASQVTEIWLYQKESLSNLATLRAGALRVHLNTQAKAKLNTLQNKEQKLLEELQKEIVVRISSGIAEKFGLGGAGPQASTKQMLAMHIITNEAIKEGCNALRSLAADRA